MNLELLVNICSPEGEPLIETKEFSDDILLVEFWLSQLHETVNSHFPPPPLFFFLSNQKHFDHIAINIVLVCKIKTFCSYTKSLYIID